MDLPRVKARNVKWLPNRPVSTVVTVCIQNELGVIPELGRESGKDLGVSGQVEVHDGFTLRFRKRRRKADIVMLEYSEAAKEVSFQSLPESEKRYVREGADSSARLDDESCVGACCNSFVGVSNICDNLVEPHFAVEVRDLGSMFDNNLLISFRIHYDVVVAVSGLHKRFVVRFDSSDKR